MGSAPTDLDVRQQYDEGWRQMPCPMTARLATSAQWLCSRRAKRWSDAPLCVASGGFDSVDSGKPIWPAGRRCRCPERSPPRMRAADRSRVPLHPCG